MKTNPLQTDAYYCLDPLEWEDLENQLEWKDPLEWEDLED